MNAWEQLEQKRFVWISLHLIRSRMGNLLETKNDPLDIEVLAIKEWTGPNKNCHWFNATCYSFLKGYLGISSLPYEQRVKTGVCLCKRQGPECLTRDIRHIIRGRQLKMLIETEQAVVAQTGLSCKDRERQWGINSCIVLPANYLRVWLAHNHEAFQNAVFTVNWNGNMWYKQDFF